MKVLYIEPHIDDIIQSSAELLFGDYSELFIISCDNCDDRDNYQYKQFNRKINTMVIPTKEIHFNYAKDFAENPENFEDEYLNLEHDIQSVLTRFDKSFDVVYIPYGLYHPHHICVSKVFEKSFSDHPKLIRYVDQPYFNKFISNEERLIVKDMVNYIVPTPNIDRKDLMLKCFRPKYLTRYEHTISESLYIEHP